MASEKFEAFYGAKNIDEYVIVKTKSLEEWKRNENTLLTDFEYISSLNKRSITAAFKNDILLLFVTRCKEEELRNKNVTVIQIILSDIPIDTT